MIVSPGRGRPLPQQSQLSNRPGRARTTLARRRIGQHVSCLLVGSRKHRIIRAPGEGYHARTAQPDTITDNSLSQQNSFRIPPSPKWFHTQQRSCPRRGQSDHFRMCLPQGRPFHNGSSLQHMKLPRHTKYKKRTPGRSPLSAAGRCGQAPLIHRTFH